MPLYEYKCKKCGHRFEEIQQYSDAPIKRCPKCKKGKVEKLLSAPAVQFKGTGWYVTDYGRKGSSGGSDSGDKGGKGDKDSGKSDSKSESKTESKSSDKKSSSKD
jgi:putative FmdB family regulatory protein